MRDIKEILNEVEKGRLTGKEAADILRRLPRTNEQIKYAKKIKIRIHDRKENKKISLPAMPIWLIEKLGLIGIKLANWFHREGDGYSIGKGNKSKYNEKRYFKYEKIKIDVKDIKEIFLILKHIPPCKLVKVEDEDAFVEINMI
ncbi:MAG: hypothetical protein N4A68_05365 [Maledivibacter sp.]|jgi:hypothetical protein|nr:hypothetical protein [Maledivibacter sp.]